LARATGVGDPSALSLTSRIEKLSLLGRGDFVASLDGWRAASGQVAIQSLSAKQGAMSFSADGALSLDEAHRPQGNLNVAASGIEPLLRRWGVSPTATALTGVLGNLLGGRSSQPQAARTIKLPLRLRDGSVFIGPIRAPVALLPLY
jgi:hypothetical protein